MEELIPGADPEQVAPAGQPFVLARPGTPVARIAADLKEMPLDEARRAYIVVETGAGAYAVVGAWELNDALAAAGPADWGRPLQEVVPHPHPARALNVEAMDSHQARTLAQARQPVLLLRQGRPGRLLPGALRPVVRRGGGGDLFTVSREVLDPYLAPPQASLEALLPKGPREPREAAQESYTTVWGEPRPRVVNFWFATPEGQALAQQRPLELGRRYLLQVNLGRRRAESLTAAGSPAIREPAPETAEGTPLHVCLFSDDFDIPQPTQALMLPPDGDSPIATFAVTPLRASHAEDDPATIEIAVYYRCNLVQAWQARVEVVRAGGAARSPQPQQGLLLAARDRDYLLPDGLGGRRLSLLVDHAPGGYRFDLVLAAEGEEGQVRLPWRARLRREDLVHLVTKARRQLTNIARSRPFQAAVEIDEPARRRALQALALLGRQLYLKLFDGGAGPAGAGGDVADWIRREAGEGAVFQVVHRARDFVFPWGLVYDRPLWDGNAESLEVALDGFWGYRYEIELLTEELLQVGATAGFEMGLGDRLRVAVGLNDRLANAREQRQLFAGLAAEGQDRAEYALTDRGPEWLRLLRQGRHELLYLFCHGFTERMATDLDLADDLLGEFRAYLGSLPPKRRAELQDQEETLFDVSDSWLKLTYGQVPLTMLRDCAPERLEAAPLVLLNMCESAQVLPSLSGGFVPFFLERGARGIIGTECPMTSTFAHAFAREFFPRFLRGQPVGRILWELRRAFLEMGNPLGLAYTLYCDAGTKLAVPVLAQWKKERNVADEALERQIENLWFETEEDLYEVLGITEEAIGRARLEGDTGQLAAAQEYDTNFGVADTAFAETQTTMAATDFFRDLGRTWWIRFEPQLHDLLCNKKNEDHDDLMDALVHGAKDLALVLAPTLVTRLDALPAAAVVLATIAAKKIAEAGLEAVCVKWSESLAGGEEGEPEAAP